MTVKIKDLEAFVARINRITGSPLEPWKRVGGKLIANIGCYHLEEGYGGYQLVRMGNEGGGISAISSGFVSKREMAAILQAYIMGLEAKINLKED